MSRLPGGDLRPPLFQAREPRRRFVGPLVLVTVLHAVVIGWVVRRPPSRPTTAREPVPVVMRLPPRKGAVNQPPGGGPKRLPPPARRQRLQRRVQAPKVIPPPVSETPPPPPRVLEPPKVAEAEEAGDEDDGDGDPDTRPGPGGGGGTGTGTGTGAGPGNGSVKSRARKAWLTRTDWRCRRPGYEELGRVVVRIRVEVLLDGRPGQVHVVKPGPEDFNRRAIDCALDERYLPALDAEGQPIAGSAEFSIEFLN